MCVSRTSALAMSAVARTTKSIRFAEEHQEVLKLLAAFDGLSAGELVLRALESFVHGRVLAYRRRSSLTELPAQRDGGRVLAFAPSRRREHEYRGRYEATDDEGST